MSDLALIHVIAIAFWLGVVAVETVFEKETGVSFP